MTGLQGQELPKNQDPKDFRESERLWLVIVALLTVVGAWPNANYAPGLNLDIGWQLGINFAPSLGLQHGSDILWAYGPLGPLVVPLALDGPRMGASLLTWFLIHTVILFSVVSILRNRVELLQATLLAAVLLLTFPDQFIPERWSIALIVFSVAYVTRSLPRRIEVKAPYVLGIGVALLVAAKPGAAIPAGMIAVVSCFYMTRWRGIAALTGSGVIAFSVIWLITGNSAEGVLPFLIGSADLILGFTDAMAKYRKDLLFDIIAVTALVGGGVAVWRYRGSAAVSSRVVALIAALGTWHWFRYSYVRPGGRSTLVFWFLALVFVVFVPWRRGQFRTGVVIGIACIAFSAGIVGRSSLLSSLDLGSGVANFRNHFSLAVSSELRERILWEARTAAIDEYSIPPDMLAILVAAPGVHVDSYELTTVWAYDLPWAPAPVLQTYSAYTSDLDLRNAKSLSDAPDGSVVLRRTEGAIDGRYRGFESPAYMTELACRYRHETTQEGWQILRKGENRCGEALLIDVYNVENGETLAIPEPALGSSIVVARVVLDRGLRYRIENLLYKPAKEARIILDGRSYRLVRGTARGPLILTYPEDPSFAFGHLPTDGRGDHQTVAFEGLYGAAVVEFWEIPIELE